MDTNDVLGYPKKSVAKTNALKEHSSETGIDEYVLYDLQVTLGHYSWIKFYARTK